MISWIFNKIADFNPESKYDWFLLWLVIYLLFIVVATVVVPETTPSQPEITPYG